MAQFKTKLKVTVDVRSNASVAVLSPHNEELISDLKRTIKNFCVGKSWYKEVYSDYEESDSVEIDITIAENG